MAAALPALGALRDVTSDFSFCGGCRAGGGRLRVGWCAGQRPAAAACLWWTTGPATPAALSPPCCASQRAGRSWRATCACGATATRWGPWATWVGGAGGGSGCVPAAVGAGRGAPLRRRCVTPIPCCRSPCLLGFTGWYAVRAVSARGASSVLQGSSLCAPRLRACLRGSQPPSTSRPAACFTQPPAQALWAYGYQAPTSVTAHAGAAFNAAGVPLHIGATLLFPCGGRAHFECGFDRALVQRLEVGGWVGGLVEGCTGGACRRCGCERQPSAAPPRHRCLQVGGAAGSLQLGDFVIPRDAERCRWGAGPRRLAAGRPGPCSAEQLLLCRRACLHTRSRAAPPSPPTPSPAPTQLCGHLQPPPDRVGPDRRHAAGRGHRAHAQAAGAGGARAGGQAAWLPSPPGRCTWRLTGSMRFHS